MCISPGHFLIISNIYVDFDRVWLYAGKSLIGAIIFCRIETCNSKTLILPNIRGGGDLGASIGSFGTNFNRVHCNARAYTGSHGFHGLIMHFDVSGFTKRYTGLKCIQIWTQRGAHAHNGLAIQQEHDNGLYGLTKELLNMLFKRNSSTWHYICHNFGKNWWFCLTFRPPQLVWIKNKSLPFICRKKHPRLFVATFFCPGPIVCFMVTDYLGPVCIKQKHVSRTFSYVMHQRLMTGIMHQTLIKEGLQCHDLHRTDWRHQMQQA